MAGERVLLASLPFSTATYPNMGLSLLKPALVRLGLGCDIRYFSLDFVERVGADAHDVLTDPRYYMALAGEWVFAGLTGPGAAPEDLRYLTEVFQKEFPDYFSASRLMAFLEAREAAGSFIEDCLAAVDWGDYAIVGFTSSFQQTMASLALARRVKEAYPQVTIAFGGANCQGEMGIELHRRYPFIDAVCLGEGDRAFPEFVRRHLAGDSVAGIDGMVVRVDGKTVPPLRTTDPVEDMDSLPYPDFADFYEQHAKTPVAVAHYPPAAVFETSRGCWWGAKHHCSFCGLNGATMAYRSKSQKRAYEELAFLAARHGSDFINADNILDTRYFEEFIPRLAAEGPRLTIYYEMKANLRPEQLTMLSRAGIKKIQPGIETFDTALLKLIDKGCTMLQNVQTLKLAAENGLYVEWLALCGLPGEEAAQYAGMTALLPKLRHLQPPAAYLRARADRFSPYFYRPDAYGVTLEPAAAYRHIFPFDEASLRRLAYHFDMRSPALDAADAYIAPLGEEYEAWRTHQGDSALCCEERGEAVVVTDERWGRTPATYVLEGVEAALHRLCWKITPRRVIAAELGARFPAEAIEAGLASLLERGLLLGEGESFLALALRQPGYRRAPSWEEIRAEEVVPFALRVPLPEAAAA